MTMPFRTTLFCTLNITRLRKSILTAWGWQNTYSALQHSLYTLIIHPIQGTNIHNLVRYAVGYVIYTPIVVMEQLI